MKKLISILTIFVILIASCATFGADSIFQKGDWMLVAADGSSEPAFAVRSYNGSDAEVTVPNDYGGYPITAIGAYAFVGNMTFTKVTLGENIAKIGDGAFMQCRNLAAVEIPDSVTEIDETAFSGCNNLVIYAPSGSYAAAYAAEHGIAYESNDPPITYMLGDADGDGKITITDATLIQRLLVGLPVDDPERVARNGDVDGGGLDITDATAIQRYLADMSAAAQIGSLITV